jgi:hypothetical protein
MSEKENTFVKIKVNVGGKREFIKNTCIQLAEMRQFQD